MANLTRWDPFREMMTWRNAMDRMFEDTFGGIEPFQGNNLGIPLDIVENEDNYVVKASLPGINPDDLEITYNNNVLTLQGEVKDEREVDQQRYHLRERRYGAFSRSISLPATIKADEIDAHYDAGVLTLTLPKAEEARPKRISVKSAGGQQKMIEGSSKDAGGKNGK